MKPKDIFKLAVRILGLVFLYHGLSALPTVIPLILSSSPIANCVLGIFMIAWPVAVAWWLIGGAPPLIRRAYPEAKTSSAAEREDDEGVGTPCVSCGKRIPDDSKICPLCGWTQPR
jgi:hypothetical protein